MTKLTGLIIAAIIIALIGTGLYLSQFNTLPQAAYTLFSTVASPKSTDRILVVSPHQDDETLGAGGYLLTAAKAGAKIEVIYATDGNKHGLKAVRHDEALSALNKLGVPASEVKFYNYPDGDLSGHQTDFQTRLKADIVAFAPTTVITTLPSDVHPDHAAAGRAVRSIWDASPKSFNAYFFLIHYHRYPRPISDDNQNVYLLPPTSLIDSEYNWSVFPLSQSDQTQKMSAILEYKSQLSEKNPILRQLLLAFDQKNELFATLNSP